MPMYEYECTKGHRFEVYQKFEESPLKRCKECKSKAHRIISMPYVSQKSAGIHVFDRAHGNRDILHDPLLSESEKQTMMAPILRDMQKNRQQGGGLG